MSDTQKKMTETQEALLEEVVEAIQDAGGLIDERLAAMDCVSALSDELCHFEDKVKDAWRKHCEAANA